MALPSPLPKQMTELISARFRLLAEPMRVRILDLLRGGERSVGELAEALETTQQNVSKHLGVLHSAAILSRRKEGNRVLYEIGDPFALELCEAVCGSLERQLGELSALFEEAAA